MNLHEVDTGSIAELMKPLHSGVQTPNLIDGRRDSD